MTFGINNDVFQFGVCSFLDQASLGNLSCVASEFNNDTSDDIVWGGSKCNSAINTLAEYIKKHYSLTNERNTATKMKIHSWEPYSGEYKWSIHTRREVKKLDLLERVLVRNIVRRNISNDELIKVLCDNDEPDEQFELLRRIVMKPGYVMMDDDLNDFLILIDMSEYANSVRLGAISIYDSIVHNHNWKLTCSTLSLMEELREPTNNYFGLLVGY